MTHVLVLQDDQWTEWHHYFVVTSPIPIAMVLLIAALGWSGFTDFYIGVMPLYVFLIMCGKSLYSSSSGLTFDLLVFWVVRE